MKQRIASIALVVRDYDEALDFYTNVLDFELVEDTRLSEEKRWLIVRPPGDSGCSLLLARAANEEQEQSIGNQTGGRVFLFLFTDDLHRDHAKMKARNVRFVREPIVELHGRVAVFADLYGNLWDLIEPSDLNSLYQG